MTGGANDNEVEPGFFSPEPQTDQMYFVHEISVCLTVCDLNLMCFILSRLQTMRAS